MAAAVAMTAFTGVAQAEVTVYSTHSAAANAEAHKFFDPATCAFGRLDELTAYQNIATNIPARAQSFYTTKRVTEAAPSITDRVKRTKINRRCWDAANNGWIDTPITWMWQVTDNQGTLHYTIGHHGVGGIQGPNTVAHGQSIPRDAAIEAAEAADRAAGLPAISNTNFHVGNGKMDINDPYNVRHRSTPTAAYDTSLNSSNARVNEIVRDVNGNWHRITQVRSDSVTKTHERHHSLGATSWVWPSSTRTQPICQVSSYAYFSADVCDDQSTKPLAYNGPDFFVRIHEAHSQNRFRLHRANADGTIGSEITGIAVFNIGTESALTDAAYVRNFIWSVGLSVPTGSNIKVQDDTPNNNASALPVNWTKYAHTFTGATPD